MLLWGAYKFRTGVDQRVGLKIWLDRFGRLIALSHCERPLTGHGRQAT
jgi:hypothetical protein